jgi:hypothetical protein
VLKITNAWSANHLQESGGSLNAATRSRRPYELQARKNTNALNAADLNET